MISLDIEFNSYRRVKLKFTNAETRAILKSPFMKGKCTRETLREIDSVWLDGTISF